MFQPIQISEQLTLAGVAGAGEELLCIEADKASNRCTAASIAAREGLRALILAALAHGLGTRRVAEAMSVSREVVRALRAQVIKSGELDQVKKDMAADYYALADAARERIMDEIDRVPLATLYAAMGTAFDKGQLLSGGVTQRVERREAAAVGDVEAYMKGLLAASSVEVVSGPVAEGVSAGQKGPEVLVIEAGAQGIGQAESMSVDKQSTVICPSQQGTQNHQADDGRNDPQKEASA